MYDDINAAGYFSVPSLYITCYQYVASNTDKGD
jgi:hypothetical protein